MTGIAERLVVDSSVLIKWKITSEEHAAQAEEVLLDWQHGAIEVCAPDQVLTEVMSACLKAFRRRRLSEGEATDAIREYLSFPLTLYKTTKRVIIRAFEIARQENQRAYDCIYVALAERKGIEFWTGDERLYNAVRLRYPFVRWIADYRRKRA
jgi:predicted nucleic acid-binding protein